MKLYDWNAYALAMTLGAWLLTRLAYRLLPASFEGWPFFVGMLIYFLSYPALGWGVIRAIWQAIQGNTIWWKSLLVVAVTYVQAHLTLVAFLLIMAEGWNGYTNR